MMCWELTSDFPKEETHEEAEKVAKKPVEKTEIEKHEEEHVRPTLDTGSRLKISIELKHQVHPNRTPWWKEEYQH